MKKTLFILTVCIFNLIQCLSPTDEEYEGTPEYDSYLSSISINGNDDKEIKYYATSSGATRAEMYWISDKPLFLLRKDDIYIVNINGEIIKKITKPADIIEMDVSPDGSNAVLACRGDSSELYLLDLNIYEIRKISNSPEVEKRFPRFSHNSQKIVYSTYHGINRTDRESLQLFDLNGDSSQTILLDDIDNKVNIPFRTACFGKDDNIVYFTKSYSDSSSTGRSKLYSLNLESNKVELIDETAYWAAKIQYASAGNRLVYLTRDPFMGIRVFDANSSTIYQLGDIIKEECNAIGPNMILNITPQGNTVVAGTDYCSDSKIYNINVENSEYMEIIVGTSPVLSWDGSTILYVKAKLKE